MQSLSVIALLDYTNMKPRIIVKALEVVKSKNERERERERGIERKRDKEK